MTPSPSCPPRAWRYGWTTFPRELLASGELQSLITGRHVVGVTINPTIFASALGIGRLLPITPGVPSE
jgi:transaldolase